MIFNACYELSARSLPEEKKYFNHLKISFEIPHRPERPFPHHHKHQKKKIHHWPATIPQSQDCSHFVSGICNSKQQVKREKEQWKE